MSRRLARELVFKILFQIDLGRIPWQEAVDYALPEYGQGLSAGEHSFITGLVQGVTSSCRELDDLLSRFSSEWTLNRMAATDRSILRLALYEILYREDIPVEVSVNEAVELAKKYGEEDSGRFVNGILGALIKELDHNGALKKTGDSTDGEEPLTGEGTKRRDS
ncbi:MAG TPA: transcription antitermination factor NusB [Firmicutes bacterium]|jgi:N utilization substance protein B|nr:transcription antitermination factor NusB [Bacillota bacterium]